MKACFYPLQLCCGLQNYPKALSKMIFNTPQHLQIICFVWFGAVWVF